MKVLLFILCCITLPVNAASLADVIDRVLPSVVIVKSKPHIIPTIVDTLLAKPSIHTGTGFFITQNLILTSYHIIDDSSEIRVAMYGNVDLSYSATLIGHDPYLDIALLEVANVKGIPVEWSTNNKLRVGSNVTTIGHPYGYEFSVSSGIVSHTERRDPNYGFVKYIQTDTAVNKGSSGGPLFNQEGKVIGIIQSIITTTGGSDGIALAVGSNLLIPAFMRIHRDKGKIKRASIGIGMQEYIPEYHAMLKNKHGLNKGLIIHSITKDGPAMLAGLISGDLIVKVNNIKFTNTYTLLDYIQLFEPGDLLNITVLRNNQKQDIIVKLGTIGN